MAEVIEGDFRRTGETFFEDGKNWEVVEGGKTKIDVLNEAVREMLEAFSDAEEEILVSVITFGAEVRSHLAPTTAPEVQWISLTVSGETPLGEALDMAKAIMEDKEQIPSNAYRPTLVLISDGEPTDSWENPLDNFVNQGRSSKCDRMAMAIGAGTDEAVLRRFIAGTPHQLFNADSASKIHEFFQLVTMSVTMRASSKAQARSFSATFMWFCIRAWKASL